MKNEERRLRRKRSIRRKVSGSPERPRMSVHKSHKNINVQIIDDVGNKTLCSLSTLSPKVQEKLSAATRKNVKSAAVLGEEIAKIAAEKSITKVIFDRSGYNYHGAVKAIADAARKGGLQF
ncbi:MAG: 50S ribosomal protein L18 [Candidatus Omnitrophota bacterium]